MKKLKYVFGVLMVFISINVMAQRPPEMERVSPEVRMQQQLDHMKVMLDLTDKQYASIKDVLKDSHAEMKVLKDAAEKERVATKEKALEIKSGTDQAIKELLSDEQQLKFDEMQKMKPNNHPPHHRRQDRSGRDGN